MRYTTQGMTDADRDAVLGLWKENMSALAASDALPERYRWFYEENPAGTARTVLAVDGDNGSIVGCASVYPRDFHVCGSVLRGGIPVDFAVSRAHRTAAAAVGIQRGLLATPGAFSFFCGFPNKAALPVLQRVGYRPFTALRAWVKPLRTNYKVAEYVPSRLGCSLVAAAPNAWLQLSDALRVRNGRPVTTQFTMRADARFDSLWDRARPSYTVAGERTSAYLNWRYAAFPLMRYEFFCLADAGANDLLGYVAFRREGDKVYVGDLFAIDMDATAQRLLIEFSRALRRMRVDSIFLGYAGNAAFEARLQRLGFIRRPGDERRMVAVTTSTTEQQTAALFDPEQWYLFDGEMDI